MDSGKRFSARAGYWPPHRAWVRTHALGLVLLAAAACRPATVTDVASTTPAPSGTATTPVPTPTTGPEMCSTDPFATFQPWIDGADCSTETPIQVQRYDANTWILRESMCTNFEGPFLYLMFGTDKAMLEDTGAGNINLTPAIDSIVSQWLSENGKRSIPLIVVNSHAHGDHVSGNSQMAARANTTLVGTTVTDVQTFFGIANWPTDVAHYDLGGRMIDVIPIPGHQTSHIALYDHATGNLLTGDTLYPGRLYISDFPTYQQSTQRLVDFTSDKTVCHVLGTHIEMTNTAGQDFAYQSTYHPNEHLLPLTRAHLVELNTAVQSMGTNPVYQAHDDFIVYPL